MFSFYRLQNPLRRRHRCCTIPIVVGVSEGAIFGHDDHVLPALQPPALPRDATRAAEEADIEHGYHLACHVEVRAVRGHSGGEVVVVVACCDGERWILGGSWFRCYCDNGVGVVGIDGVGVATAGEEVFSSDSRRRGMLWVCSGPGGFCPRRSGSVDPCCFRNRRIPRNHRRGQGLLSLRPMPQISSILKERAILTRRTTPTVQDASSLTPTASSPPVHELVVVQRPASLQPASSIGIEPPR
jgi:hypothetical protein